jgi:pimeloyl-ACP methyl ester carboxylesterase
MGAGSVGFPGRAIQAELGDGWQVWAEDRREVAFVDRKGFAAGSAAAARAYYLRLKYHRTTTRTAPFVRKWGLKVALEDLRRVIKLARAGGRSVVLGGHSLGAQEAIAYAAWDFNGRPGYKDLRGLVLIDGGEMGAFSSAIPADALGQAHDQKAAIENHEAFGDVTRSGRPWIASIMSAVAGLYARKAPSAPSAMAADPLVTSDLRPPFPTTNAGFLGNMFDQTYSRPGFESLRVRMGDFAAQGNPRPWVDGENASVARLAAALSQSKPTFGDWNFPCRLTLDANAADSMAAGPVTNFLGLRVWHTAEINVPLYAYQTDLTSGGVLTGAQNVKNASQIPELVAVDDSADASHLDPLIAPPRTNRFIQTVVPFLRSIG